MKKSRQSLLDEDRMKQINKNIITSVDNDREPSCCVFCDAKDRGDSCDATDSDDNDSGSCDFGTECTHIGQVLSNVTTRVGSVSFAVSL